MTDRDAVVAEVQRTIIALARDQDYDKLQKYVLACTEPHEVVIAAVWTMLDTSMIRGAYFVSKLLHLRGVMSPPLSFALYFGGIDFGNLSDAADGRRLLGAQFDAQTPEARIATYAALEPLILQQVAIAFNDADFTAHILRLLDALKQVVPEFRTRFDLDAPAMPLDIAELQRQGRAKARLIEFAGPASTAARPARKAIVAMRRLVFPHFANSRVFEQGHTMTAALNAYGWKAQFHGLAFNKHEIEDAHALVAACQAAEADVLIVDAVIFNFHKPTVILAELHTLMPNMKIVGLYFDAWSVTVPELVTAAAHLDVIWTVSPDFAPWSLPELKDKVIHVPLPRGGDYGGPTLPLQPKLAFIGGIAAYNWHRALWIAAMRTKNLPIETHLDAFTDDKLPPLESYLAYMRRLADGRCAINFSMRQNMSTFSVTARTFEILAAGSLLVQERAPEADCFLIEGEHYLPFSSFAELSAVVKFICERPAEAEAIRRNGSAFFRARYGDNKLIAYLDRALYS